jgi:DNA-binding transcriptional ArsR family regulator
MKRDTRRAMPPVDLFESHADFCKTLAHPKRLMILALLGKREMSVGQIADVIGVSLPNVSQHLAVLKRYHLVVARKEGQTVHYRLADRRIIQACTLIRSVLLDQMKARGMSARTLDPRYIVTAV